MQALKIKTGFFILSAIGMVAFLAGCASFTSQEKVDSAVRDAVKAEAPLVPEEWSMPSDQADVRVGWISTFNDPTLAKLVQEAQANNKKLQAAAASLERALALAEKAGAAIKPTVDLSAGAARSGTAESGSSSSELSVGLRVGWELDVWGRIRAGIRAAEADAQAMAADYRYAQHSLAATTTKAYVTAIAANEQGDVARKTLSILQETVRIVNAKHENGLVSAQDLALSRSDLARARERLTTAIGSQKDALRALEILIGRYPSAELKVQKTLPDVPPPPPAGLPSELLERRPDVVSAERQVASAFNVVAEAKAAKLPRLRLTSDTGGSSSSLSDIMKPENLAWQLGANLLTPIFDGGKLKAEERIETAEQKQALAQYGDAVLNAFSEVETLLDQGVVLNARLEELTEARRHAEKAYRIAALRHKEGETELLDVLTIQERLTTANSDVVAVQRLLLEQRVNLHLALGGSWDD